MNTEKRGISPPLRRNNLLTHVTPYMMSNRGVTSE
jgi:hypothetical protein